jgi:hypothetical protein
MWPFSKHSDDLFVLLFEPTQLTLSLVRPTKSFLHITAATSIELGSFDYVDGVLCNLSKLANHIEQFMKQHSLSSCFAACALGQPIVAESIIHTESSTFKEEHSGALVHSEYLYPSPNGQFCFLVTKLLHERLFPYHLLASTLSLNLVCIAGANVARLFLYKKMTGTTFRQSQLAQDMHECSNKLELLKIPHLDTIVPGAPDILTPVTQSAVAGISCMTF